MFKLRRLQVTCPVFPPLRRILSSWCCSTASWCSMHTCWPCANPGPNQVCSDLQGQTDWGVKNALAVI